TSGNYFVSEHGTEPPSYRYHPLFQTFLLSRAKDAWTIEYMMQVRRKAARALARAGEAEAALELFLTVADDAAASELIIAEAPLLIEQGRGVTVSRWVDRLPKSVVEQNAWLSFWAGVACLGTAPSVAVERIERAYRAFSETEGSPAYWQA